MTLWRQSLRLEISPPKLQPLEFAVTVEDGIREDTWMRGFTPTPVQATMSCAPSARKFMNSPCVQKELVWISHPCRTSATWIIRVLTALIQLVPFTKSTMPDTSRGIQPVTSVIYVEPDISLIRNQEPCSPPLSVGTAEQGIPTLCVWSDPPARTSNTS